MGLRDTSGERAQRRQAERDAVIAAQMERHAALTGRVTSEAETARRQTQAEARERLRADFAASCPLPLAPEPIGDLPSGVKLQPDEFLVTIGKEFGWGSQRLLLTTHRVIQARGRALTGKSAASLYLSDVRDVRYHKALIGLATITLESSSGAGSLEGLPAAKNGAQLRDQLTALVHWARTRQAGATHAPSAPPAVHDHDPLATIKRLAELRDAGAITPDEFETKKRELLDRL